MPMNTPKVAFLINLPPDIHRRLKVLGAASGRSMTSLIVETISGILDRELPNTTSRRSRVRPIDRSRDPHQREALRRQATGESEFRRAS
jgi:plasmid stability protein